MVSSIQYRKKKQVFLSLFKREERDYVVFIFAMHHNIVKDTTPCISVIVKFINNGCTH